MYTMKIYVDGACRGNGHPGSKGAAAAVIQYRNGMQDSWTRILPYHPPPTNQRAEITAIMLAQELALEKIDELHNDPRVTITIYSDSKYAIGCMTDWVYKWRNNGWINSGGNPVANRDLIQDASDLHDRLEDVADVNYIWIPREINMDADRYCNEALDRQG